MEKKQVTYNNIDKSENLYDDYEIKASKIAVSRMSPRKESIKLAS